MTTDDDLCTLTAAYALGAVDAAEAADFEALLERDPVLRAEVEELRATAADLAWTTEPVDPSPRLKVDLMAMLDATPQLPPLPAATAVTDDDRRPAPVKASRSRTIDHQIETMTQFCLAAIAGLRIPVPRA